jgi:hypothetical protein
MVTDYLALSQAEHLCCQLKVKPSTNEQTMVISRGLTLSANQ